MRMEFDSGFGQSENRAGSKAEERRKESAASGELPQTREIGSRIPLVKGLVSPVPGCVGPRDFEEARLRLPVSSSAGTSDSPGNFRKT